MKPDTIPFQVIDFKNVNPTSHAGETGVAYWQTLSFQGLRIRKVEYAPGYLADHWCRLGHIIYCLEGAFTTELATGEKFQLKEGMMYIVSDDMSSHRSHTDCGVKLLIVDGDFLNRS